MDLSALGEVERDAELLRGDRLGLRARCRGDKNCQF